MWARKATEIHAKITSTDSQPRSQSKPQEVQRYSDSRTRAQHSKYDEVDRLSSDVARCASTSQNIKSCVSHKSRMTNSNKGSTSATIAGSIKGLWNSSVHKAAKSVATTSRNGPCYSMESRNSSANVKQIIAVPTDGGNGEAKKKLHTSIEEKWDGTSIVLGRSDVKERTKKEPSMNKIKTLRRRIQEGKMERVISPSRVTSSYPLTHCISSPLPSTPRRPRRDVNSSPLPLSPSSRNSSRLSCQSRNRKTKSTTSTILSIFESGADALDETRRDLQSRFKPPFEHLNSPSILKSAGGGDDSDRSSETSFHCAGEQETDEWEQKYVIRMGQEMRRGSTSSGAYDAWEEDRRCGFCGEYGVRRLKNLCTNCEARFLKRRDGSTLETPLSTTQKPEPQPTAPLGDCNKHTLILQPIPDEILKPTVYRYCPDTNTRNNPPIPLRSKARCLNTIAPSTPIVQHEAL